MVLLDNMTPVNFIDSSGNFVLTLTAVFGFLSTLVIGAAIVAIEVEYKPIYHTAKALINGLSSLAQALAGYIDGIATINPTITTPGTDNSQPKLNQGKSSNFPITIIKYFLTTLVNMGKSKGGGLDSGLGKDFPNTSEGNSKLEKALEAAKKARDSALVQKLQREQKNRGERNKRKKRGGPQRRGGGVIGFLTMEIIRRVLNLNGNIFERVE